MNCNLRLLTRAARISFWNPGRDAQSELLPERPPDTDAIRLNHSRTTNQVLKICFFHKAENEFVDR